MQFICILLKWESWLEATDQLQIKEKLEIYATSRYYEETLTYRNHNIKLLNFSMFMTTKNTTNQGNHTAYIENLPRILA